jgi:hypothetical protein
MTRVKKQHLIYRGPDGLGGFRHGHAYAVRVGMRAHQRYLLHPVTQQPWMVQPTPTFWEHWEQLKKQPGQPA